MTFTEKFHRTYLLLYITAVASAFFLSSYLKYPIMSAVSYSTNDGWCNPQNQGLGQHCFGDYYYPLYLQSKTYPWTGNPNPYPPLALEIYRPFQLIDDYLNSRIGLIAYLTLLAACVGLSTIYFVKKRVTNSAEFSTIILGTIASAPFFSILDRGNSAVLLFPILLLWILSLRSDQHQKTMILIIAASLIRPQFILLALVFILIQETRLFVKTVVSSALITLLSFLLYGLNAVTNLVNWVSQIISYQDYAGVATIFPVNISFANTLNLGSRLFLLPLSPVMVKIFSMAIFLLVAILYFLKRETITLQVKINACLILPIFFVSTTFHYYYFIISLILINTILDKNEKAENDSKKSFLDLGYNLLSKLLFFIVLIPWALPWSLLPSFDSSRGWTVTGAHWIIAQVVFSVYALWLLIIYPACKGRLNR